MKPVKEILDKFYQNLNPNSTDLDFERFILRLRREAIYDTAWKIQALGEKATMSEIKQMVLESARENVLKGDKST